MLAPDDTWVRQRSPLDDESDLSSSHNGHRPVADTSGSQRSPYTRVSRETYFAIGLGAISGGALFVDTPADAVPVIFTPEESQYVEAPPEATPVDEQTATDNEQRLTLLARKYVQERFSTEEQARLAIVTERVRNLMPRLSIEELEQMEALASRVEELDRYDMEVRQRLDELEQQQK